MRVIADACGGLHEAHELRGKDGSLARSRPPRRLAAKYPRRAPTERPKSSTSASPRHATAWPTRRTGDPQGQDPVHGARAGARQAGRPPRRRLGHWRDPLSSSRGRPPYKGPNQLATLHLLTSGRPPLPLPPGVPAPSAVIARALAHDPECATRRRPSSSARWSRRSCKRGRRRAIADVAEFAAEHLASRAKARREAVELALSAAAERARVEDLLQPTANDTRSSRISAKVLTALGAMAASEPVPPRSLSENSSATIGPAATMISPAPENRPPAGATRGGDSPSPSQSQSESGFRPWVV